MTTFATANQPKSLDDVRPQPNVEPQTQAEPGGVNVAWVERRFSLLGGIGLAIFGLTRRSLPGLGLTAVGAALVQRGITGHCSVYNAFGVNTADRETPTEPGEYFQRGIHVGQAMTIQRSAEELFRFWRDFSNLPRFMQHLKSVEVTDDKHSDWTARGPAGMSVQWKAEIINEDPNSLISWRSVGGSEVDNAGSVRFVQAPGDRGTEVRVVMDYIPPAGQLGDVIARLFGESPRQTVREDLRRFKALMESGEIPTTTGQPRGTCKGSGRRQKMS
jgi:uncharacterized membrane protein